MNCIFNWDVFPGFPWFMCIMFVLFLGGIMVFFCRSRHRWQFDGYCHRESSDLNEEVTRLRREVEEIKKKLG